MTLPEGWARKRLDQLGKLWSGSTPSTSIPEFWDGDIVWVTPTDLSRLRTPYLDNSTKRLTERGLRACSAQILPPGSIVLSSRAPIGYVAIPSVHFCTNQGCKSLELNENAHSEYIYYSISFDSNRLKSLGEGTTFAEISKRALSNVELTIPQDREEQAKIAEVLLAVDRALYQTEALVAKHQRIRRGLMQDLLTRGIDQHGNLRSEKTHEFQDSPLGPIPQSWDARLIEELLGDRIIIDIQDGNHGELHPKSRDFVAEGIPFIMAADISEGYLNTSSANKISHEKYKSLRIGFAKGGDVLLSHKASVGFVALVPDNVGNLMLTPQVTYYRVGKPDVLAPEFLAHFFRSEKFQNVLRGLARQSTRDYIGILAQRKLWIAYPRDIREQIRVSSVLDAASEQLRRSQARRDKLTSLKRGLMQDLLSGKRRVSILQNETDQ